MRDLPIPKQAKLEVHRLQEYAQYQRRQAQLAPVQGGVQLSGKVDAGGTVTLRHALGHVPTGWIVTDITGGFSALYRSGWGAEVITLVNAAPANVAFSVYVY